MGHSVGVTDSYYKPTENELLTEYLKAVGDLMILDTEYKPQQEDIEELKKHVKKQKEEIDKLCTSMADLNAFVGVGRLEDSSNHIFI